MSNSAADSKDNVLLWHHKYAITAYGMSDGHDNAFLKMFGDADKIGYYANIEEDEEQLYYYRLAKEFQVSAAARMLINMRCDYEYENYDIVPLV